MKRFGPCGFGAAAAVLLFGPLAFAAGAPAVGNVGGAPGMSAPSNFYAPTIVSAPQWYRDLRVSGYVEVPGRKLPPESRVIRLRVDGRVLPMLLGPETTPEKVLFGPNDTYARRLFRSILTKQIVVVGNEFLRARIVKAAELKRLVEIRGYVFDPTSPYMVLRSVTPLR